MRKRPARDLRIDLFLISLSSSSFLFSRNTRFIYNFTIKNHTRLRLKNLQTTMTVIVIILLEKLIAYNFIFQQIVLFFSCLVTTNVYTRSRHVSDVDWKVAFLGLRWWWRCNPLEGFITTFNELAEQCRVFFRPRHKFAEIPTSLWLNQFLTRLHFSISPISSNNICSRDRSSYLYKSGLNAVMKKYFWTYNWKITIDKLNNN